eukprot:3330661-Rhodomonas_salina.2
MQPMTQQGKRGQDAGHRIVRKRGACKPEVFKQLVDQKNRKHYDFHRRQGIVVVPLVGTTSGRINIDSVILCHVFAHHTAKEFYTLCGWTLTIVDLDLDDGEPTPSFLRLRSRFFSCYKGRIAQSVCRAAGSRGMMSGLTCTIRSRRGVDRRSDLDF